MTATPTTRALTTATSAAAAQPETIPRAWRAAPVQRTPLVNGLQVGPVPRTPAATAPEILRDPATPDLRAANIHNFGTPHIISVASYAAPPRVVRSKRRRVRGFVPVHVLAERAHNTGFIVGSPYDRRYNLYRQARRYDPEWR